MIFLKKNLKINAQSTNLNTVAKYYDAQYTMVTTVLIVLLILGDRPAERCRSCSNPPSRVRLKMPGKTKTSAYLHTLRFFGGRGWIARAAHLKKPRKGFFARRTIRRADAVRIHPPDEFSLVAKQKPQRTFIR